MSEDSIEMNDDFSVKKATNPNALTSFSASPTDNVLQISTCKTKIAFDVYCSRVTGHIW